jgi:hypothetical protein
MKRCWVLPAIVSGWVLAVTPAQGTRRSRPAPPTGEAWQEWQGLITKHFAHARIAFSAATAPFFSGGHDGCPRGPFQGPGLLATVSSRNPRVFGDIEVAIFRVNEGADGYAYLRDALNRRAIPHEDPAGLVDGCAFVGNTAIAVVQVGSFWVEVFGHCYDGALYKYEVGEVLAMVQEKGTADAPSVFAVSECGKGTPAFVGTANFLDSLRKPASYWGRRFPDARDQARTGPVEMQSRARRPTSR